jgi:hypothetical protein
LPVLRDDPPIIFHIPGEKKAFAVPDHFQFHSALARDFLRTLYTSGLQALVMMEDSAV